MPLGPMFPKSSLNDMCLSFIQAVTASTSLDFLSFVV